MGEAPQTIWVRITDGSIMPEKPSDADGDDHLYHHDATVGEQLRDAQRRIASLEAQQDEVWNKAVGWCHSQALEIASEAAMMDDEKGFRSASRVAEQISLISRETAIRVKTLIPVVTDDGRFEGMEEDAEGVFVHKNDYDKIQAELDAARRRIGPLEKALRTIVRDWDGEPEDMQEAQEALRAEV